MKITDILNGHWAVESNTLSEISAIYNRYLSGQKINISELKAQIGVPLSRENQEMEVHNNVAIIQIDGVLADRMNMLMKVSGGTSYELLRRDFKSAFEDSAIKGVVCILKTPGGTVDGLFETTEYIFSNRGKKPMAAINIGSACSAGYLLAASIGKIYNSGPICLSGSIGVITSHTDISEAEKMEGVKTTKIFSGKYKGITSEYKPLTKEGEEYIQEAVDYSHSIFIDYVAKYRDVTVDSLLPKAEGQVFIGEKGIKAGLIDGTSTVEKLINEMSTGVGINNNKMEGYRMEDDITIEMIGKDYPDIVTHFRNIGMKDGEIAGAESERKRIQSIDKLSVSRQQTEREKLISSFKEKGMSAGDSAIELLAHDATRKKEIREDMESQAPHVLDDPAPEKDNAGSESEDLSFMALVSEHQTKHNCKKRDAIRVMQDQNPKAYDAYIKNAQKGGKS